MSGTRQGDTVRAGRAIVAALRHIHDYPGCSKSEAARVAVPGQPVKAGHAAVNRAVRLGLVSATGSTRRYHLQLTPAGYAVLDREGYWG